MSKIQCSGWAKTKGARCRRSSEKKAVNGVYWCPSHSEEKKHWSMFEEPPAVVITSPKVKAETVHPKIDPNNSQLDQPPAYNLRPVIRTLSLDDFMENPSKLNIDTGYDSDITMKTASTYLTDTPEFNIAKKQVIELISNIERDLASLKLVLHKLS